MTFIDEAHIKVTAGKGGDGIISFQREYRIARGGPDGGNGGRGGSIYFLGDSGINTLMTLKAKKNIIGNDGKNGKRKNMYGSKGADIIVKVPLGTVVYHGTTMLVDIKQSQKYLIAQGGQGGRGNVKFKTARNLAPKLSEKGALGQAYALHLVLKVLADIGFVGKPNAGKSTLLSKLSNAHPKIAAYEFTTLHPHLGIVHVDSQNSFVVADLPGLIKGAAQGKGLGHEFLKHIERCQVLAHIIDFGSHDKNPIEDFRVIQQELAKYSEALAQRQQVIIANKMDHEVIFKNHLQTFQTTYPHLQVVTISALQEQGLQALKLKLFKTYQVAQPIEYDKITKEVTIELAETMIIKNPFPGMFEIEGTIVAAIYNQIPLTSWANLQRFNKQLQQKGVWKQLLQKGVKAGDTVRVFGYEFEWTPKEY